ncbi:MAG: killer suppression protein HigA [Chlorobiaceae bacterium]|nr:killer suppression protein HigA [Chlorobiaceae bacterium]
MKLRFSTRKLEKSVESFSAIQRHYGNMAKKVDIRLQQLSAASNLEKLIHLNGLKCHELHAERSGELSVRISPNHRIVFRADHEPPPEKEDGGLDWKLVTAIVITAIAVDYH